MPMRNITVITIALALSACGSSSQPGGITEGEARALDEAAEMIEKDRLPAEALRPPAGAQAAPAAPAQKEAGDE